MKGSGGGPEPLHPDLSANALISRQPILDRSANAWAYELLCRDEPTVGRMSKSPHEATATVILNAFVEIGLQRVAGKLPYSYVFLARLCSNTVPWRCPLTA